MSSRRSSKGFLVFIVFTLWLLSILCVTSFCLIIYVFATRQVDKTMSVGLILTLICVSCRPCNWLKSLTVLESTGSLLNISLHCILSRQIRLASLQRRRTRLDSACSLLPRFLIVLWIATTAVGLILAAREPICKIAGLPF